MSDISILNNYFHRIADIITQRADAGEGSFYSFGF